MGWPNTQRFEELSTTAPPITREKDRMTVQRWPFQRSARDLPSCSVNAQTLVAELAADATTTSLAKRGKAPLVQVDPFPSQAVDLALPSNAPPPFRPTAVTAVKMPL